MVQRKYLLSNGLRRIMSEGFRVKKLALCKKPFLRMIWFCSTQDHHEGTTNGQGKEAASNASAGEDVARVLRRVSHTRGFQASPKDGRSAEETTVRSPSAVAGVVDGHLVLRRFVAGKVRGGTGLLCGLPSETSAAGRNLSGISAATQLLLAQGALAMPRPKRVEE